MNEKIDIFYEMRSSYLYVNIYYNRILIYSSKWNKCLYLSVSFGIVNIKKFMLHIVRLHNKTQHLRKKLQ